MSLLTDERIGPGQTLLQSDQFPRDDDGSPAEFEVRVWGNTKSLSNTASRLFRNVVHVYVAEGIYVIIRADKNVFTFPINVCRLEIN